MEVGGREEVVLDQGVAGMCGCSCCGWGGPPCGSEGCVVICPGDEGDNEGFDCVNELGLYYLCY